jgi:hypothetical protein
MLRVAWQRSCASVAVLKCRAEAVRWPVSPGRGYCRHHHDPGFASWRPAERRPRAGRKLRALSVKPGKSVTSEAAGAWQGIHPGLVYGPAGGPGHESRSWTGAGDWGCAAGDLQPAGDVFRVGADGALGQAEPPGDLGAVCPAASGSSSCQCQVVSSGSGSRRRPASRWA